MVYLIFALQQQLADRDYGVAVSASRASIMDGRASGVCSAALWNSTMLPGCTPSVTRRVISEAERPFQVQAVHVPLHRGDAEGVYRVDDVVVVFAVGAAEERGPDAGYRLYLIGAGVYLRGDLVAGEAAKCACVSEWFMTSIPAACSWATLSGTYPPTRPPERRSPSGRSGRVWI